MAGHLFDRALPYYVVALATFFKQYDPTSEGINATWHDIQTFWSYSGTEEDGPHYLLDDEELFELGYARVHRGKVGGAFDR